MSTEKTKILNMLSEGKINVEQAEKLLSAIEKNIDVVETSDHSGSPKFLCIQVEPKSKGDAEQVNIRIPFQLVRAGMKIGSLMPINIREKVDSKLEENGVHFKLSEIDPKNIEEFIQAMNDFKINVDTESERVDIYCE